MNATNVSQCIAVALAGGALVLSAVILVETEQGSIRGRDTRSTDANDLLELVEIPSWEEQPLIEIPTLEEESLEIPLWMGRWAAWVEIDLKE